MFNLYFLLNYYDATIKNNPAQKNNLMNKFYTRNYYLSTFYNIYYITV